MFFDFIYKIVIIITNAVIFTGVVIAWKHLNSYQSDNELRKKQITIDFYHNMEKEFMKSIRVIRKEFPGDMPVDFTKVKEAALENEITDYLNFMHNIATGINEGIYDIELFDKMSGRFTILWHKKLEGYLKHIKQDNPNLFDEYEELVKKLNQK